MGSPFIFYFKKIVQCETLVDSPSFQEKVVQSETLVNSPFIFDFKKIVHSETLVGPPSIQEKIVQSQTLVNSPFFQENSSQWNFGGPTLKTIKVNFEWTNLYFLFQEHSSQWNFGGLTLKKKHSEIWVNSPFIFYSKKIVHSETLVDSPLKKITVKLEWTHLFFKT